MNIYLQHHYCFTCEELLAPPTQAYLCLTILCRNWLTDDLYMRGIHCPSGWLRIFSVITWMLRRSASCTKDFLSAVKDSTTHQSSVIRKRQCLANLHPLKLQQLVKERPAQTFNNCCGHDLAWNWLICPNVLSLAETETPEECVGSHIAWMNPIKREDIFVLCWEQGAPFSILSLAWSHVAMKSCPQDTAQAESHSGLQ